MRTIPRSQTVRPATLPRIALSVLLILAAGIAMTIWTWRTWLDVFVDFGRELYLAWQLSNGKVLYRDLAYYNGPLSPYLNSIWFRFFGVGLSTLIWCNLAIAGLFVVLLYRFVKRLSNYLTATAACLCFIFLFAFSQYVTIGNYNFVCPYSHDAVHGLVLSFFSLFQLGRFRESRGNGWLIGAGLACGLVFLTRTEVFVALAAAAGSVFVAPLLARRGKYRVRSLLIFLAAAALPGLVAFSFLWIAMPFREALFGTLGAWPATLNRRVSELPFFRSGMGFDQVGRNVGQLMLWFAGYLCVFGPLAGVALLIRRSGQSRTFIAIGLGIILAGGLAWIGWNRAPMGAARPLPLMMLMGCGICVWRMRRSAETDAELAVAALPLFVFSLVLLGKMILNTRFYHYGFYLTVPAATAVVIAATHWIPVLLDRLGGSGRLFQIGAIGILAGVSVTFLRDSARQLAKKSETIGIVVEKVEAAPGQTIQNARAVLPEFDQFPADQRGKYANLAVQQILQFSKPDETLVVLPEGVMLNYLTRRMNPTPHTNFMPTEMMIFGEESITRSLRENAPDWIALVHKDTREFGYALFGADYAQPIHQWIRQNYSEYSIIGGRPLEDPRRFGLSIWKKK